MSTICPGCGCDDCYNSGFSIECWNNKCRFYTQKQYDAVLEEMKRRPTPVGDWDPFSPEEKKVLDAHDKKTYVTSSSGSYAIPASWSSQNKRSQGHLSAKVNQAAVDATIQKIKDLGQLDLFSNKSDDEDDDTYFDFSGFINDRDDND